MVQLTTDVSIIQIMVIIFTVFAWSRAFLRFKDKKISVGEFAFWSVIWLAVLIVAILPGITVFIAEIIGIRRGIDVAVYSAIIVLFYIIFRLYVKLETMQHDVTKLVRELTLRNKK